MKIYTLNKEIIKSISNENVNTSSLLSLINSRDKIENIFIDIEKPKGLKDIPENYDVIVIDFMEDIKFSFQFQDLYFSQKYGNELILNNSSYKNKIKLVDPITLDIEVYRNVFNILFNKLVRSYSGENIIFLNIKINCEEKIVEEKKIALNEDEKSQINIINSYLNNITKIVKEELPNIRIINIEDVYFEDINNRTIVTEKNEEHIKVLIEETIEKKFKNEKIFPSTKNIRYVYEKAKIYNKEKLIVVFSAFSNDVAKYNYINTLKVIDCNKLFILDDYGVKGTYYLGLDGNLDIETSVASLITYIMSKDNISFNNVISVGSSKGGTAALYYGMKYNFGNIIVGAPQYKVGTYLSDLSIKDYADEIFGKRTLETRMRYDNMIRLISNNYIKKNIYLLTSDGDNQYKKVLKEFEFIADELEIELTIEKCNINHHNEISKEYPQYMIKRLCRILKKGYISPTITEKIINYAKRRLKKLKN